MSGKVFLDTETVTLAPGHDVIWEVGLVTRDEGQPDEEWLFQLRPNMGKADPESLKVGRFEQRYLLSGRTQVLAVEAPAWSAVPAKMTFGTLAFALHGLLRGRAVFGLCPGFDALRLGLFLAKQGRTGSMLAEPWHYQLHDVEDEVAGYLRGQDRAGVAFAGDQMLGATLTPPYDTGALAGALGVGIKPEDKHTALGDARFARDLHDAVHGRPS